MPMMMFLEDLVASSPFEFSALLFIGSAVALGFLLGKATHWVKLTAIVGYIIAGGQFIAQLIICASSLSIIAERWGGGGYIWHLSCAGSEESGGRYRSHPSNKLPPRNIKVLWGDFILW